MSWGKNNTQLGLCRHGSPSPLPAPSILLDFSWSFPFSLCAEVSSCLEPSADLQRSMHLALHQWAALLMSQRFNEIISTLLEQPVARTAWCLWNTWSIYVRRSWNARIWWDSQPSIGDHCSYSSRVHTSECSWSKDDCWLARGGCYSLLKIILLLV